MIKALFFIASYIKARTGSELGATAVEYGLMVALVGVVIAAGAAALGVNVLGVFNDSADDISTSTAT